MLAKITSTGRVILILGNLLQLICLIKTKINRIKGLVNICGETSQRWVLEDGAHGNIHILPLLPYSKEHLLCNDAMSEISVAYKNETLNYLKLTRGSAWRK